MDKRPLLIGTNNPHSEDPRLALFPYPRLSSGYRLWHCAYEVSGMTRAAYLRAFDRCNILNSRLWDPAYARTLAPALMEGIKDRAVVVVLGQELRDILGLKNSPYCRPRIIPGGRGYWRWLPHPSPRSHWYNYPDNRALVGILLTELAYEQA